MRTRYWRFAYDESALDAILASDRIPVPELPAPGGLAKNTSEPRILGDLKPGHFVFLANYDESAGQGVVRAIGRVRDGTDGGRAVDWRRRGIPMRLTPEASGGVHNWKVEPVFCFDVQPAKRYKLGEAAQKAFPGP